MSRAQGSRLLCIQSTGGVIPDVFQTEFSQVQKGQRWQVKSFACGICCSHCLRSLHNMVARENENCFPKSRVQGAMRLGFRV